MATIIKNIENTLNNSQRRTMNRVYDWIFNDRYSFYNDKYEIKEQKVEFMDGDVHVTLTVGMNNDEGTLAECLCRDTYMFFIGKRGGIFHYGKGFTPKYIKPYELSDAKLRY